MPLLGTILEIVGEQLAAAMDLRSGQQTSAELLLRMGKSGGRISAREKDARRVRRSHKHKSEDDMQIITGQQFSFSSNGTAQLGLREFDVNFQVTSATAVIEGFDVEFANRIDHNVGRL